MLTDTERKYQNWAHYSNQYVLHFNLHWRRVNLTTVFPMTVLPMTVFSTSFYDNGLFNYEFFWLFFLQKWGLFDDHFFHDSLSDDTFFGRPIFEPTAAPQMTGFGQFSKNLGDLFMVIERELNLWPPMLFNIDETPVDLNKVSYSY